jgi:hypothetical protein
MILLVTTKINIDTLEILVIADSDRSIAYDISQTMEINLCAADLRKNYVLRLSG